MNYIREINAFYDWLETNVLSLSAIALWHALMHINNKTAWTDEFAVAVSVLCVKTGLSPRGVTEARNELKIKGRIDWRSRKGNQAALYNIVPLILSADIAYKCADNHADKCADNHADKCADNHADKCAVLNKLNIKEINNNIPPIIPPNISDGERQILNQLQTIAEYPLDYEKDLSFIRQLAVDYPTLDILDQVKGYSTWMLDHPYKKNANPRSQFRNWCKNAKNWSANKKVVNIGGSSNRVVPYRG